MGLILKAEVSEGGLMDGDLSGITGRGAKREP
jgi:hypothetical protein